MTSGWDTQVEGASLMEDYAYCERLTKETAKNFYYAFITLPKRQRQAIYAGYAYCRICDDAADDPPLEEDKVRELARVDTALTQAIAGQAEGPVFRALADTVATYGISWDAFSHILEGVRMDLTQTRYETFEDLRAYCYRVASMVGLVCIEVFGYNDARAAEYAVDLGLGMQLTNILRDIREDAERGRIYLPQDEMERFGYAEADLMAGVVDDRFVALMRHQVARTREYFDRGRRLLPLLPVRSRACPAVLGGIYSRVLNRIEANGYDVFQQRISLSSNEKVFLTLRIWLQSLIPVERLAAAW